LRITLTIYLKDGYITITSLNCSILKLRSSDSNLPKAYGLPKVHKINFPYRIIVSSVDTAPYSLSSFLQDNISISLEKNNSCIANSFDLYDTLSKKRMRDIDTLISLNVTSLFTNVPFVLDSVSKRWSLIEINTKISKNEFIQAIKFVFSSTYFTFNNIIYKQTFGTPMGSPLSPVIADESWEILRLTA